ncbi:MBL fold metallo-hydrolase [Allosphingosinicella sp.]|uniref:MBL fold metallo-hydrolase n=1 Tax=Allosphingosinicella sp. TaxID=2823234 RepID=UPI002F2579B1
MKVRILGCGTSLGVPRIGNDWGACDPADPRNRRRRVAILVSWGGTRILVDTGPDLREQLLDAGVDHVDAVIWTHDHADHCHGIDDLRQLYHARGRAVNGFARAQTLESLRRRFGYVFEGKDGYPSIVAARLLQDDMEVDGLRVRTVDQPHGPITSAGLRFDAGGRSIVYSTDFNDLTPEMEALFEGVDLWIVDALRRRPHPTHPHLERTVEWIAKVGAKRAILTHMDNSMDYRELLDELPPGVEPGYDGLEAEL